MATASRFGRNSKRFAPLLVLLLLAGSVAAPFSAERVYRLARAAADDNNLRDAQPMVETALASAGNDGDDPAVWSLRVLQAEIIAKQGAEGGARAREMLKPELPPRFRTSEAAVRRLLALGIAWFTVDREQTVLFFRQAHRLAAAHQPQLLFKTHVSLGNTVEFAEAEVHLRAATEIAERHHNPRDLAVAEMALAWRYTQEGRLAQSVEAGEDALAAWKSAGVPGRIATASGNLGWAYLELGNRERAMELFGQALDAATRAGLSRERVGWLNSLGNVAFAERDFAEADRYFREALAYGRETKDDQLAVILTNLARTALERSRFEEARRLNAEAAELKRAAHVGAEDLLRNRILDGRIAMMTRRYADAERALREVVAVAKKTPALSWEADARLAQLYARTGRAELARESFSRAIDTVRTARQSVTNAELRLSFFNVAKEVFDTYVDFLVQGHPAEEALVATEAIRAQTLREQLDEAPGPYVPPREIARERGLTVLSYWLGHAHSYVWTITPADVTVAELPPDQDIGAAADAYRRELLGPGGTMELSGGKGRALFSMLVEPALHGNTPATPVAIVADGRLHALNFETLVTGASPHYWIEDVVLSSASSVQLLARRGVQREHIREHVRGMFLVGDPLPADPAYPPLRHAREEIDSVTRHFREKKILTRDDATPAAYRAADPGRYEYLHFVAHGVASRQRPLDSAIILGFDADRHYKLIARDVVDLPLAARLVTISSCHGAGERTFTGEGLVGLAWAFLHAGADQVIAALWKVDDTATPALMDDLYAGIQAGKDPATALRDAKLKLVRSPEVYRRPLYWAPFVLYSGS